MARRSYYIAILIALISTGLLIHLLVIYGFGQRFSVVLIILIAGIFSWGDGFEVGCKEQRALLNEIAWRALVGTFVIIPLYVIVPIVNGGIQLFIRDLLGLILVGIICWTSGLRYGKLQHRDGNICLRHLPFSLALGCTLFYTFTAHGFSHVLILDGLIVGILNLSLLWMLQRQIERLRERDGDHPLIYSQRNWSEEFSTILAVEVSKIKGRLPIWEHEEMLRDRYRNLAEKSLSVGHHPEDMIRDFLNVLPAYLPTDDPQQIADSLLNSLEFESVLNRRDDRWGYISTMDQTELRRMYDGTSLEEIVRLLREEY